MSCNTDKLPPHRQATKINTLINWLIKFRPLLGGIGREQSHFIWAYGILVWPEICLARSHSGLQESQQCTLSKEQNSVPTPRMSNEVNNLPWHSWWDKGMWVGGVTNVHTHTHTCMHAQAHRHTHTHTCMHACTGTQTYTNADKTNTSGPACIFLLRIQGNTQESRASYLLNPRGETWSHVWAQPMGKALKRHGSICLVCKP